MTDANTEAARMLAACTSGDEATVRELLRETPSLASHVPVAPLAPLHYAVREGHASIVQLLLEHGADAHVVVGGTLWGIPLRTVDVAAARGFSQVVALVDRAIEAQQRLALSEGPLRRALRENDLATIQREVQRDPSVVNTTDEHGNTPLHRAAQADDTADSAEFMEFLLDHGAALDVPNHLGYTPVYVTLFAYPRPRWKMFELLLARGAAYDINLACVKGDIDKVRALLAADAGAVHFQASCKKRPLSCAAEFGRRDIVALLLAAGADPNAQEADGYHTFPLVAAAKHNDLAMVEMLLEHGANPNAMIDAAEVALSEAIERNREMANLIASYGGAEPIHCLAWGGDIVTLAAVLRENPKLALSAIYIPNPERPKEAAQALRLALHHGVNPKDICLWSLFRASGNAPLLRVFLEAGADPNVTDEDGGGCTLLHYLTGFPATKPSIEVLLDFKANIHARDGFFGFTPLTWAVVHRRLDMVQFLLAHGAIELPDDQPWTTPRFWAKHLEDPAIMQALAG
ncbi:MAG TPA: ankyrin repeat domain-containing protein [Pirellulales bacterium]|jgi:ankyrin repeat protein|nr:ankyrin repeat domain-containing protein [Pirellulales bacterium]